MFRLALSSHIHFFAFRDTNRETLVSLRLETRDVATRVSGRERVQSTELDMEVYCLSKFLARAEIHDVIITILTNPVKLPSKITIFTI